MANHVNLTNATILRDPFYYIEGLYFLMASWNVKGFRDVAHRILQERIVRIEKGGRRKAERRKNASTISNATRRGYVPLFFLLSKMHQSWFLLYILLWWRRGREGGGNDERLSNGRWIRNRHGMEDEAEDRWVLFSVFIGHCWNTISVVITKCYLLT